LSNMYWIMSGNNSILSASRAKGALLVGAILIISINNVAKRQHRRWIQMIENANKKLKRFGGNQDYHPFDR
jgi:hypothetical protein